MPVLIRRLLRCLAILLFMIEQLSACTTTGAAVSPATPPPPELKPAVPGTVRHALGGHVVRIIDEQHVEINRGSSEWLCADQRAREVLPVRSVIPGEAPAVVFSVRQAVGQVQQLRDHSAIIALSQLAGAVQLGDYVRYSVELPADQADEPLFEVASSDITLLPLQGTQTFAELAGLLANPQPEHVAASLDACLQEVHELATLAQSVLQVRIEGGRFHGLWLGDAFARSTRQDLADFVEFMRAYPGKYMGHSWKFVEIYATWIINRTPSGAHYTAELRVGPLLRKGTQFMEKGDSEAAERLWRQALDLLPDDKRILTRLKSLETIRIGLDTLRLDPDDTAARFEVMKALYDRGRYDDALQHLERLQRVGFKVDICQQYRGFIDVRQGRPDAALAIFAALGKKDPQQAKSLDAWRRYALGIQLEKTEPKAFAAAMALAQVNEEQADWDEAALQYQHALDRAATPEQFQRAAAGPERLAVLRELQTLDGWIADHLADHEPKKVDERIGKYEKLCGQLQDNDCLYARLSGWADVAFEASDWLRVEQLHRQRVTLRPQLAQPRFDLAYVLLIQRKLPEALLHARRGVELEPSHAGGWQTLGAVQLALGDLPAAKASADKALQLDPNLTWGHCLAARWQLLAGDGTEASLADALQHMKRSLEIAPDDAWLQGQHAAVVRWAQARRALGRSEEVPRNHLRIVRSAIELGLPDLVTQETAALSDPNWQRRALQSLADTDQPSFSPDQLADAARRAGPRTPAQVQRLALVQALANTARDEFRALAPRVIAAKALVAAGRFHQALVLLGDVQQGTPAADAYESARRGLGAEALLTRDAEVAAAANPALQAQTLARAFKAFTDIGAKERAYAVAFRQAALMASQGESTQALAMLQTLIRQAQGDGTLEAAVDLQRMDAQLRFNLGDLQALPQVAEAVRQRCADEDRSDCLAQAYMDLADFALDAGKVGQARTHALAAETHAQANANPAQLRRILFQRANIELTASNLAVAQTLAERLIKESRRARDPDQERLALLVLGALAVRRGDVATARQLFQEVYELGQRVGVTWVRALSRQLLGRALLDVGHEPALAVPLFEQALKLYQSLQDDNGSMRAWQGLAEANRQSGRLAAAQEAVQKALEIARKLQLEPNLAQVLAEQALVLIKQGQVPAAVQAAQEAMQHAQSLDVTAIRWPCAHALGRALEAAQDLPSAAKAYDEAVTTLVDQLTRAGSDADRHGALSYSRTREVFKDAMDLQIRLGNVTRAMEILELSRDAELRRIFEHSGVKAQDGKLSKVLVDVRDAEQQAAAARQALDLELAKPQVQRSAGRVEALGKQVAQTDGELRQLLLHLKRDHRQMYALLAVNPESLSELRSSLPPQTTVVEYFVASDAVYAFVLAKDQPKPHAFKIAVAADVLERAVFDWRRSIGGQGSVRGARRSGAKRSAQGLGDEGVPEGADADALSTQLYDWLLQPLEAELSTAHTVLIVPFGPLYYLPLHALQGKDAQGHAFYALEKYRIGYLSSTTIFRMLGQVHTRQTPTLLAFANPDGTLPGARAEMERVRADSFPDARVLLEGEATKAKFFDMAGQFRIVHFATHGILAHDALASHLKMAGDTLSVDEITGFEGMQGHTDLVVLSACETAIELGRSTGDEVISIASAFATAGAPALVASLWDVDDEATSELMVQLYSNLKRGNGDTLDALRNAQLAVLRMQRGGQRPFAAPAYWAAFELIGDFR